MSRKVTEERYFFAGVDPAPSEGQRSDDGAIVGIEAIPNDPVNLTNVYTDWKLAYRFGKRVRKQVLDRSKGLSAREWAGVLHDMDRRFHFRKICMDPNGGGTFVARELASNKTVIRGIETGVTPIVTREDTTVVVARIILCMFKRGDPDIEEVWPGLAGDDPLNDAAYSEAKELIDRAAFLLPKPFEEWDRKELEGWPEEQVWSLKMGTVLANQLKSIQVAVREDGTWALTKRGARQFSAGGKKKDFVSGFLYANVAFRTWLATMDDEFGSETTEATAGAFYANEENGAEE